MLLPIGSFISGRILEIIMKTYGITEINQAKKYFKGLITGEDIRVNPNEPTYKGNLEAVLYSAEQLGSYNHEQRLSLMERLKEMGIKPPHIPSTVIPSGIEIIIELAKDCKHEEECTLSCRTLRDMVGVLGSYLKILMLEEQAKPQEKAPVRCC